MSTRAASPVAWLSLGVSIALAAPALFLATRTYPSLSGFLSSQAAGNAVLALAFPSVGALIVLRRPANRIGWLLCIEGVTNAVAALAAQYARYTLQTDPGVLPGGVWMAWLGSWSWVPGLGLFAFLPLLFPDGRLLSNSWRPVPWLAVTWIGVQVTAIALRPGPLLSSDAVTGAVPAANPIGLELGQGILVVLATLWIPLLAVIWAGSLASLAVRFRHALGRERDQLKWFLHAAAVFATAYLAGLPLRGSDVARPWIAGLVLVAGVFVPVSVGIAILKHRLYDIDRLINRTLVYGVLTAGLGFVYWGGVVVLQQVLRPFTQGSELAVAGSTLAVWALFQPARRRIQATVDRRFYRSKYDAAQTLEAFSGRMQQDVDLDAMTAELLGVVHQTLQPAQVSLWLRPVQVDSPSSRAHAAARMGSS